MCIRDRPTATPTLSTYHAITESEISPGSTPVTPFGRHTCKGDWNGFRWLNKFDNTFGPHTISGTTTFSIYPSTGRYAVAKHNEDFDPTDTVKSYAAQPVLVENASVFFDELYGSTVGMLSSDFTAVGRVAYEKISNFTPNVNDIDTCNIKPLYSMCEMLGIPTARYDFNYSGGLHRIMNIVSIPHKKLWGERSRFNRDFETYGTVNDNYGKNLGLSLIHI